MAKTIINRLCSVKSLVTLSITAAFIYMSIKGNVNSEFTAIYTSIIGFYFGTQTNKQEENKTAGK